jgi:hypothetical protein
MSDFKYKQTIAFGVIGNFANHLKQAGERDDFVNMACDDEEAPKGLFPIYVPNDYSFLGVYPFSSDTQMLCNTKECENVQLEAEIAIKFKISYCENTKQIQQLIPKTFMPFNDCSIRKEGAKKISIKKNWGNNTKGVGSFEIPINKFSNTGIMDKYSLISYIKRDDKIIQYGENAKLTHYYYFYEQLQLWLIDKLNTQKDEGVLQDLSKLIKEANYPKEVLISIGATSYTNFGENNFLNIGDELYVVTYNNIIYNKRSIEYILNNNIKKNQKDISILNQIVKG